MMESQLATKEVISADLENVGQGHRLQKLYFGYYVIDFNQTFTKIMHLS